MKINKKRNIYKGFTRKLLKWNLEKNIREMPWKGEKDPYKIWLSEIILQQTRVDQGLSYYNAFINSFPTVHHLAKASDKKIFKLWEGLGYYSRCRNLISTGRYISKERKGNFPESLAELKALRGIGPYTAAAIASFAFNLPYAVVDGNVSRVLSRVFGIDNPIDSIKGKKIITDLADQLLNKQQPGNYNQAIMDFGAVVCKPSGPLCNTCPFTKDCFAYINNRVNEIPVKAKKITVKKRWFYFLVLNYKNRVVIRQRTDKDIWKELFEFPAIETAKEQNPKTILQLAEKNGWIKNNKYNVAGISQVFKQQLSHQLIHARFLQIQLKHFPVHSADLIQVSPKSLSRFTFPGIINNYRNEVGIGLKS